MKKALIVDDSAYNRTLLNAILRKKGLLVETSDNGEDAVGKFQIMQPDIVFLDYIMPKKSGVEALAEMKQMNPNFIGVMLTSISSADDVQAAKTAGANAYILKPYEAEKIYQVLTKFKITEE
ncbi:MAG: response regulator [Bacteroidetes bacterium]|nr:response regulator [Bacteroidota bacterium]